MTAKAHRPGEAAEQQAADLETVKAVAAGQNAPIVGLPAETDLGAVETATETGRQAPAPENAETEAVDLEETPLVELKALGNAKADVNVTAVRNAHGFYTWAARDAENGEELARSPRSHTQAQLAENLLKLFGGDAVIALRRTGDDKARRLA